MATDILKDLAGHPKAIALYGAGWNFARRKIRCGKAGCACAKKPTHGPYWYAFKEIDGRTRSTYVGKELPERVRTLMKLDRADGPRKKTAQEARRAAIRRSAVPVYLGKSATRKTGRKERR
jgi:hypothetical protein